MHITKLLEEKGFKKFRYVFNDGEWEYIPSDYDYFTTMKNGGLCIIYKKGDKEVVWGLSEYPKPPTLVHPRPKGIYNDDAMNNLLSKTDHEEILNSIFI